MLDQTGNVLTPARAGRHVTDLTIAKEHIRVHSELEHVEFIPLNDVNAFNLENPLAGLADNGMVFVQSPRIEPAEKGSPA